MCALLHKWASSKKSKNKPRWANSILLTLVSSSAKPVEGTATWSTWVKGLVGKQNSPAAHWNALVGTCTPQIPSCCCSSCQGILEFRPHFMALFAPVSTDWIIQLSQTDRENCPDVTRMCLYSLQRTTPWVRPMSGFWLRLRGRSRSAQVTKFWA